MEQNREYDIKEVVYGSETIEFVTVAVEYCIFLESFEQMEAKEFADKLTKILPLLYLKAQLVPQVEDDNEGMVEDIVTEEDYNFILHRISSTMGQYNDYLEVFVQDIQYSDEPILAHIAEGLADIYQDLRNFAAVYERGIEEHMNEALYICLDNFKNYWGQTLTNVLRALHAVRYSEGEIDLSNENVGLESNEEGLEW